MGTQLPPKGAQPPLFGPCLLWPNGCMHQDTAWYGGRPQPRRHCLRWGPSSPTLKGHSPNFRLMSVVVKRLDGLRCTWCEGRPRPRRLCVREGPSSPYKKGTAPNPPNFGPCLLWPNGCTDQDATCYGGKYRGKPRPRQRCVRWNPSSPIKGHSPQFSAPVYCGHGRPSQLLLSSCSDMRRTDRHTDIQTR